AAAWQPERPNARRHALSASSLPAVSATAIPSGLASASPARRARACALRRKRFWRSCSASRALRSSFVLSFLSADMGTKMLRCRGVGNGPRDLRPGEAVETAGNVWVARAFPQDFRDVADMACTGRTVVAEGAAFGAAVAQW